MKFTTNGRQERRKDAACNTPFNFPGCGGKIPDFLTKALRSRNMNDQRYPQKMQSNKKCWACGKKKLYLRHLCKTLNDS